MASVILTALAVLFFSIAVVFQSQDIGPCPIFITGQTVTCTIYYPGTTIPIEPTVQILLILGVIALAAGTTMLVISRHHKRNIPASDSEQNGTPDFSKHIAIGIILAGGLIPD